MLIFIFFFLISSVLHPPTDFTTPVASSFHNNNNINFNSILHGCAPSDLLKYLLWSWFHSNRWGVRCSSKVNDSRQSILRQEEEPTFNANVGSYSTFTFWQFSTPHFQEFGVLLKFFRISSFTIELGIRGNSTKHCPSGKFILYVYGRLLSHFPGNGNIFQESNPFHWKFITST